MPPDAPVPEELIGRRLAGRYRVDGVVARGGMAVVFRARDERLQRAVAIKVLSEPYASDDAFVARFLSEARTAASFSHPNIAHVYDSGSDAGVHFIVLELLDGHRSLRAEIREHGPLGPERAIVTMLDVLAGLEPLHSRGTVHCDVKSGNVLIGPGGAKLIDFGIARPLRQASDGRTSIGSLHVMSPEQLRGEPLTPASDLFAVGVVLFEALTGRVPFPGESPEAIERAHRHGPVAHPSQLAPGIVQRLDDVVLQALRTDPGRRFASATAMSTALRAALDAQRSARQRDEDTTSLTAVPAQRRKRRGPVTRSALLVALAVAVVPLLIVGALLAVAPETDGTAQPNRSQDATPLPSETLAPGMVRVPDTIGMGEDEAIAAAQSAGLRWRLEWQIVADREPGIHDQEPPAGTVVEAGSRFVMYAYRNR